MLRGPWPIADANGGVRPVGPRMLLTGCSSPVFEGEPFSQQLIKLAMVHVLGVLGAGWISFRLLHFSHGVSQDSLPHGEF